MARPDPHSIRGKLHEIDVRYGRKSGGTSAQATLRVAELTRLFTSRYGNTLPDDDAGRDDAWVMLHHLALISGDPRARILPWLARWAPWMSPSEIEALIADVLAKPIKWRAPTLGKKMRLTAVERQTLRITTFRAFDMTKAQNDAAVKKRKRAAERLKRRLAGAKPRADYEANAIGHGKPWIAEGISMATWYRRQKQAAQQLQ